jgi:hypothetical protein
MGASGTHRASDTQNDSHTDDGPSLQIIGAYEEPVCGPDITAEY